jgi:6-methylsalicylate decarboxylase
LRIDAHTHLFSAAYADAVAGIAGTGPRPPVLLRDDLEEYMDAYAVDAAVVSCGPPGVHFGDPGQAHELARMVNEDLAAVVRARPERFAALAILPLPDVAGALDELAFALDTLHMDGVALLSNVAGTYVGDPAWEPLYEELARRRAFVFLHPTFPPNGMPLDYPAWLYEFPFETTRALTNLIYRGVFERYKSIRWQIAHAGGATAVLAPRIASLAERSPEDAAAAPAGVAAYLSSLFYDTGLANDELPYRAISMVAPTTQLVFGSDWPYLALPPEQGDPAPRLSFLSEEQRESLESGNVGALVPRLLG